MNPKKLYTERIKTLTDEIYQLNKYNRLVVVLELTAIALAIGCVVAYTIWGGILVLVVAALFIAVYVAIRWKDSKNSRLSEQKESIRCVYQKEVAYLDGDFSGFPSGEQYVNPRHEFTLDLDIAISWQKNWPRHGCGVSTRLRHVRRLSVNCQKKSRCVLHSLHKAEGGR